MEFTFAILLILIGFVIGFSMAALLFTLFDGKKEKTTPPPSLPRPAVEQPSQGEDLILPQVTLPPTAASPPAAEAIPKHPYLALFRFLARAFKRIEVPPIAPAFPSIVSQIDAILQENIKGTPLEQRGIRLVEQPDHEMVVMIGWERYPDLNAVPDSEVQAAIRTAVTQWEQQSTPRDASSTAAR